MKQKFTIVLIDEENHESKVVHVQADDPRRAMLKCPRGEILAVFIGWHINKLEVEPDAQR